MTDKTSLNIPRVGSAVDPKGQPANQKDDFVALKSDKLPVKDLAKLAKAFDVAGINNTQTTLLMSIATFMWEPNVEGALSIIGSVETLVGAMTSINKQVSTDELSMQLDAISKQIADLQEHMDQSFEKLDRRIGEIANEIDWTYALSSSQPAAVFITDTCWARFQELATGGIDEQAKDDLAREFLQNNTGALLNQLNEYYEGIVGADLSLGNDLSLVAVFLRTSWEKLTKGVDEKNRYACDYVSWVGDVQTYAARLLKHLIQGITLHLWALKRIRPGDYEGQKKKYDEKWIPSFHAKLRQNLPLMTVDYFDPRLWTDAGEQPPATFRIESIHRSDHTLTRGDPASSWADLSRVPLLVDADGAWHDSGPMNGTVSDWRSRADLKLPFVGDPGLGFRAIIQGGKYLTVPASPRQRYWQFEDAQQPVPDKAQFRFASSNTTWADRDVVMIFGTAIIKGTVGVGSKAVLINITDEPEASDFAHGDMLQLLPYGHVDTLFPKRALFRIIAVESQSGARS